MNGKLKAVNDQLTALTNRSVSGVEEWAQRVASAVVKWEPVSLLKASGGDQPPVIDASAKTLEVGPQETRPNTLKLTARLPAGRLTALRLECGTTATSASFQWSELKLGQHKLRAIAWGDSLASGETEKVLDNDRKTRTVLAMKPERPVHAVFEFEPALAAEAGREVQIELGVENAGGPSRWRLFATEVQPDLLTPAAVEAITRKDSAGRSKAEQQQLAAFRIAQQPDHRKLNDELGSLKKQVTAAENEIPTTLVMEEQRTRVRRSS